VRLSGQWGNCFFFFPPPLFSPAFVLQVCRVSSGPQTGYGSFEASLGSQVSLFSSLFFSSSSPSPFILGVGSSLDGKLAQPRARSLFFLPSFMDRMGRTQLQSQSKAVRGYVDGRGISALLFPLFSFPFYLCRVPVIAMRPPVRIQSVQHRPSTGMKPAAKRVASPLFFPFPLPPSFFFSVQMHESQTRIANIYSLIILRCGC